MLYSVTLGKTKANNNWSLDKDNYGNSYIANSSIKQKIRFTKNINPSISEARHGADYYAYDIPKNIFFSNNNKNMNLNMINFNSKNENADTSHVDSSILYLTISCENYKMLEYKTNYDILQTYRSKDNYVGCAIVFNEIEEHNEIISFKARDKKTRKFVDITVTIEGNDVVTAVNAKMNQQTIRKLISFEQKQRKFDIGFKISVPSGLMLTNTYITDEEHYQMLLDRTSHIKNARIIVLNDGDVEEITDEVHECFVQNILDENVRAITLCNVTLPKDFCKLYRILYMFTYDEEKDLCKCIRSN